MGRLNVVEKVLDAAPEMLNLRDRDLRTSFGVCHSQWTLENG